MQIQDIVKVYETKTDEQLMQLAAAEEQLTSEARLALQSELSRRRISYAASLASLKDVPHHDARYATAEDTLQEGERQGVGEFVAGVLRTYHNHFWLIFKITAPAVIISTIAIITGRNEGREIAHHLPRGFEPFAYRTQILQIFLSNFLAWLVSWMVFSFAFGATCIAVEEIAAGFRPSAWRSLLNVRERLGPFLRLCILLFVLMLAIGAASGLLSTGVFRVMHRWQMHPTSIVIWVVSYGIAALGLLVLSRFALAVPAVLLDDCRVGQAMFRSDELTQRKWLTLAALLSKSLIGGYVAAMWPFWLASFVRVTAPLPSWFPWVLTLASILGVSVVEPTMFVGFALLYLKMSASRAAPSEVMTTQLA
jgi:hypothetical protein